MPICHIYTLFDPAEPDRVGYVGKTISKPVVRLQGHIDDKKRSYKRSWIESIQKLGRRPQIRVIESVESEDRNLHDERERYWIGFYRAAGHPLTNLKDGGEGGALSEDTKRRISESKKGKPSALRGRTLPEDTKRKIGAKSKGRQHSPEARQKISESLKGREVWNRGVAQPPEVQERLRTQTLGRKRTDEEKRRIGQSAKERWADPAYKSRLHESMTKGQLRRWGNFENN